MYITVSAKNKILLEAFKNEALEIKQEATELSISLLIELKTLLFQFILSYKEYSLTNIREHGLTEILMQRALRFFKLDRREEQPQHTKQKPKEKWNWKSIITITPVRKPKVNSTVKMKKRRGHKYILKRIFKVILFPFYIILLVFGMLLKSKSKRKSNKYVKNVYRE